ncbi:V-type ATPase subunit [Candidatus Aerophobetes bacterium]|nr:V-type ATPase subunit [Candidatus Aerophobetes bacterium]
MKYLEITTRDTRYVYPTGRIRGLEKYLLKNTDFARIKEAKDFKESFQNLVRFYPYSESMKICKFPEDFERGLDEEWKRTYLELLSFVPEPELIELFWLEQDFHNMKVLFKLYAQKKLPQEIDKIRYLSPSGTLSVDILIKAIAKEDFFYLPSFLKDVIKQTMVMIEKGVSAREIEIFLDRVYIERFHLGLISYNDDFLVELGKRIIDSLNIKNFLRIKLWKREDEGKLLEEIIIDGGSIAKKLMVKLAGEPVDSLVSAIKGSEYALFIQKALEEWREKSSLFILEKSLDEILLDFTHKGFYITFGREPLINYIMIKRLEIKKLRSLLRARRACFSSSQIEEVGL